MPYIREKASPIGFLELLTDENQAWITKRLKTYVRRESERDYSEIFDGIMVTDPTSLPQREPFKTVVAVDGSLSTINSPDITALKIASVWKDMTKKPKFINGIVDPRSLLETSTTEASVGLLPGRGVFTAAGGNWDVKFREEFYQNLRHIKIHGASSSKTLLSYLREAFDSYALEHPLQCPNCGVDTIDFADGEVISSCSACFVDVYFTDYVTRNLFTTEEITTAPMILMEKLLIHGVIEESLAGNIPQAKFDETLFISDGTLQFFRTPELAKVMRERTQAGKLDSFPSLVSFMKSGRIQNMFAWDGMDEHIPPGHVAMVTSEAWKKLFASRGDSAGYYGKTFAYRTKRGDKWFAFMMLPKIGDPIDNTPIGNSWANFPSLSAVCEFIEEDQSDINGPAIATLDVVGRANKAASLPFYISKKVLSELVYGALNKDS